MMNSDWTLSKRLVACKHWRWMRGMQAMKDLAFFEGRVCAIIGGCIELALDDREPANEDNSPYGWHEQAHSSIGGIQIDGESRWNHLPDLTDPATLGCVMQLVWEAWFEAIYMEPQVDGGWLAIRPNGAVIHRTAAPYAETLIIALEAAP